LVRLLRWVEKFSLRFADEVITISDPAAELFRRRAVPHKQVTVIMNTVGGNNAVVPAKRPHAGFRCVYHGTITSLYGLDLALAALARVRQQASDITMHIYGDGPQIPELNAQCRDLNIKEAVVFTGQVPYERMLEELAGMDLGVLPLPRNDFLNLSFSNKLAEYIYLQIPVVMSDLDAVKYYFTGDDVLFFKAGEVDDLADKIRFAYHHQDIITKMAESAFEKYKAIDWTVMSERYLKVIEN
jgi:glycosyltransferase involved in cell wall biosynthesis